MGEIIISGRTIIPVKQPEKIVITGKQIQIKRLPKPKPKPNYPVQQKADTLDEMIKGNYPVPKPDAPKISVMGRTIMPSLYKEKIMIEGKEVETPMHVVIRPTKYQTGKKGYEVVPAKPVPISYEIERQKERIKSIDANIKSIENEKNQTINRMASYIYEIEKSPSEYIYLDGRKIPKDEAIKQFKEKIVKIEKEYDRSIKNLKTTKVDITKYIESLKSVRGTPIFTQGDYGLPSSPRIANVIYSPSGEVKGFTAPEESLKEYSTRLKEWKEHGYMDWLKQQKVREVEEFFRFKSKTPLGQFGEMSIEVPQMAGRYLFVTRSNPFGLKTFYYLFTNNRKKALETEAETWMEQDVLFRNIKERKYKDVSVQVLTSPFAIGVYTAGIGAGLGGAIGALSQVTPRLAKGASLAMSTGFGAKIGYDIYGKLKAGRPEEAFVIAGQAGIYTLPAVAGFKWGFGKGAGYMETKLYEAQLKRMSEVQRVTPMTKEPLQETWTRFRASKEISNILQRQRPGYMKKIDLSVAERITPEQAKIMKSIISSKEVIGGSTAQQAQMYPEFVTRQPRDIEILLKSSHLSWRTRLGIWLKETFSLKKPELLTKEIETMQYPAIKGYKEYIYNALRRENIWYNPETKVFDIHMFPRTQSYYRYGFSTKSPRTLGKFQAMKIEEQIFRKGISSTDVAYEYRWFKDIPDFINIAKSQLKSAENLGTLSRAKIIRLSKLIGIYEHPEIYATDLKFSTGARILSRILPETYNIRPTSMRVGYESYSQYFYRMLKPPTVIYGQVESGYKYPVNIGSSYPNGYYISKPYLIYKNLYSYSPTLYSPSYSFVPYSLNENIYSFDAQSSRRVSDIKKYDTVQKYFKETKPSYRPKIYHDGSGDLHYSEFIKNNKEIGYLPRGDIYQKDLSVFHSNIRPVYIDSIGKPFILPPTKRVFTFIGNKYNAVQFFTYPDIPPYRANQLQFIQNQTLYPHSIRAISVYRFPITQGSVIHAPSYINSILLPLYSFQVSSARILYSTPTDIQYPITPNPIYPQPITPTPVQPTPTPTPIYPISPNPKPPIYPPPIYPMPPVTPKPSPPSTYFDYSILQRIRGRSKKKYLKKKKKKEKSKELIFYVPPLYRRFNIGFITELQNQNLRRVDKNITKIFKHISNISVSSTRRR